MGKVYVLGAGASKGLYSDSPLMDNLSVLVWRLVQSTTDTNLFQLKQFFKDFYGPRNDHSCVDLETILTQFDTSIIENRPLSATYSVSSIMTLRNSLVYCICKVLQDVIKRDEAFQKMRRLTDTFLDQLRPNDVIISLNYDLLIDNRLLDGTEQSWRPGKEMSRAIDYGIEIRSYANRFYSGERADVELTHYPPSASYIKLYKLHGSLNWLYNPYLRTIDVVRLEFGATSYIYEPHHPILARCPISGVEYEPVIVTPSFIKDYNNRYIQEIWD